MDRFEQQERKREARRRLRAQRRRAGELRGRVVAASLIGFVLLWGVVFVQMATGNDPVLGDAPSSIAASHRGGAGNRSHSRAEAPARAEPEVVETEPVEAEPVEPEIVEPEPEPEPEPAPVTTSQS